MPSSNIPVPERETGNSPSRKSNVEDLRRHNTKLRSDLEAERAKVRQVLRDKSAEIKRIQENFEKEKQKAVELTTKRLMNEHAAEIRRAREGAVKEKDNELRQVVKFKEEEVKTMKQQIAEEKEKNRSAEEELRRVLVDKGKEGEDRSEIERKLRSEIAVLRDQKQKADEMYRLKAADDNEKAEIIRRLKAEHDVELQKFLKDSKRESIHSLQQRRLTERALEEKAHELAFKDHLARKLEAEKGDLQRRLSHSGDSETLRRSSLRTDERLDESPLAKKDKERELKKRNAELQSKVESLEKKCAVLEKEASKSGNLKVTFMAEEKIKKLKKRNSELVSIARQLEDKAKKLQEEKVTAQKLAEENNSNNTAGVEHVKKMYARQRAKDLAEHAKSLMSKEKELEDLKKQLVSQQNVQVLPKEKVEELQTIIRQSAKERLWLERQVSNSDLSRSPSPYISSGDFTAEMRIKTERLDTVEAENIKLKLSLENLQKSEKESKKLADDLKEKEKENEKLLHDLEEKQTKCSKLELERERFAAKCTMLQKKNTEMSKKISELEEVEEEVANLREKLEVSDMKNSLLSEECNKMKSQLEGLLHVKEDLKKMEEKKKVIEKEHMTSMEKLKEREEEIRQLHKIQEEANRAHEMAVTSLEDTVRSLEQKCIDAEENNINLKKEVEELRELEKAHIRKNQERGHKSTQTAIRGNEIVIGNDGKPIHDHPLHEEKPQTPQSSSHKRLNQASGGLSSHIAPTKSSTYESKVEMSHKSPMKQPLSASEASQKPETGAAPGTEDLLDVLASRIDQLAASDSEDDVFSEKAYEEQQKESDEDKNKPTRPDLDLEDLSKRISQVAVSDDTSSLSTRERACSDGSQDLTSMAEGEMGDLEDNQPDSSAPEDEQTDLSAQQQPIGVLNVHHYVESTSSDKQVPADLNYESNSEDQAVDSRYLEGDFSDVDPAILEKLAVYIARYSYDPLQHSPNDNPEMELAFQAGDYLYVFGEMDEDGYFLGELMSGQRGLVPSNFVEKVADESEMNRMMNGTGEGIDEIVNSDEEDTDEDSASEDGETSTELVLPEENGERHMKPVRMLRFSGKLHRALRLSVEHIPDVGLNDIKEEDEEEIEEEIESEDEFDEEDAPEVLNLSQDGVASEDTDFEPFRVPSPRRLYLERQFTRSVLLSWKPADLPANLVKGYGVYVNGDLRLMINGGGKTKALLEDIDPEEPYRISVRTITFKGNESSDRSAVVTIGKDANLAPSHVHVTCVSPTSAKIEWSPGNSSFSHEVLVNGELYKTVRPGTFQHTITNLDPDHMYKVHVRAKNPKRVVEHDNEVDIEVDLLTAEAEFRTEPGGLPDPPLEVEVAVGHANSLDVNWIPVTITERGTSNGARVTGYKVYINGFPCTEVTSPTADSVTAVSWMVERAFKRSHSEVLCVVVRTQSCEGESVDSNEVELPAEMFNFKVNNLVKPKGAGPLPKRTELTPQSSVEEENSPDIQDKDSAHDSRNAEESRERADSVRRYSRGENGQPHLVIKDDTNRVRNVVQGDTTMAQPRTKGEPVIWKDDNADESEAADSVTKSDERVSDDEDEEIEICIPDASDDLAHSTQKEPDMNAEQQGYQLPEEQKNEDEELEESKEEEEVMEDNEEVENEETEIPEDDQHFGDEDVLPIEEETPDIPDETLLMPRKENSVSVVSGTDMDEFEEMLDEAQSIRGRSPEGLHSHDKRPYIRPLEYEESDYESESSEEKPLSVIQEEDEEDLSESVVFPSNFSRQHSTSDDFQSDDDVMDLLDDDDDRDETAVHGVDFGTVRKISQNERNAVLSPEGESSGDASFGRYLAKSDEEGNTPLNSHYRLLDSIELEESESGGVETSFSETEADRGGMDRSSTPLDYRDEENVYYNETGQNEVPYDPTGDPSGRDKAPLPDQDFEGGITTEEQVRVFLALYDYDPSTMSPNPDAEEEELAFNEGDLIKVYGDKDEDGFYWGELNDRAGYIPFNMVSEVQLEDEVTGSNVTSPSSLNLTQEVAQVPEQSPSHEAEAAAESTGNLLDEVILEEGEFDDPRESENYQLPPRRMVALFDYDPRTLSPNPDCEVELKFKVGDVIYVYGGMDEDGFFSGELRGIRGLVPSNFLEDLSDPPETTQEDSSHNDSYESPLVSADKYNNVNGTHQVAAEDSPKKKKGILSKGKQMFKKIAKAHNSPRGHNSKR